MHHQWIYNNQVLLKCELYKHFLYSPIQIVFWFNFWFLNTDSLFFLIYFFSGPGEMRVSLDFNRQRQTLIVRIGGIRDVKLPAGKDMPSFNLMICYVYIATPVFVRCVN